MSLAAEPESSVLREETDAAGAGGGSVGSTALAGDLVLLVRGRGLVLAEGFVPPWQGGAHFTGTVSSWVCLDQDRHPTAPTGPSTRGGSSFFV